MLSQSSRGPHNCVIKELRPQQRWLAGPLNRLLKVTEVSVGAAVNRCTDALLAMLMKSLVPGSWTPGSPWSRKTPSSVCSPHLSHSRWLRDLITQTNAEEKLRSEIASAPGGKRRSGSIAEAERLQSGVVHLSALKFH